MTKTSATTQLENEIYLATSKVGVYSCFEVTIGIGGNERVDYMTLDTNGVFRCFEIKVSVSDFRSKAKNSFCGHFNYYVMTRELYEKVRGEIPSHVGVYVGKHNVKKAKRQDLAVDENTLTISLLRSLSRDANKLYKSRNPKFVDSTNLRINRLERELRESRSLFKEMQSEVISKYGRRWYEEEAQ